MSKEVNVRQYILKFGKVYTIGIIILTVGFVIFDLSHSAYALIVVLLGTVIYTASEFLQDHKRVPNNREKMQLILLSLMASWVILLVLALISLFSLGGSQAMAEFGNMLSKIGAAKVIGAVVLVSLLHFVVLFLGYGKFMKIQFNIMRNRGLM